MPTQAEKPIISVGIPADLVPSFEGTENQSKIINEALHLYRKQICPMCMGTGVSKGVSAKPVNPESMAKRKTRFARQVTALVSPDDYKWLKNNFPNQGDTIRLALERYFKGECVHCGGSGLKKG